MLKFWKRHSDEKISAAITKVIVHSDHYVVTMEEIGGSERHFREIFEKYGPGGHKTPRPYAGDTAKLVIDSKGEVVYAGTFVYTGT